MKTTVSIKMFSLAAVLCLFGATQAQAAKIVDVKVHVDKKPVYESYYEQLDYTSVAGEWVALLSEPDVGSKVIDLKIDPAKPLKVTLKGEIVLKVRDTTVQLKELTLVRDNDTSTKWHLAKEELIRAAALMNDNDTLIEVTELANAEMQSKPK